MPISGRFVIGKLRVDHEPASGEPVRVFFIKTYYPLASGGSPIAMFPAKPMRWVKRTDQSCSSSHKVVELPEYVPLA